jgi:hypothetical protein
VRFDPEQLTGADAVGKDKDVDKLDVAADSQQFVMNKLMAGGDGAATLLVSPAAHDSYDGSLIQVRHMYTIRGETGSCMTNPQTAAPVFILPIKGESVPMQPVGGEVVVEVQPSPFQGDWQPVMAPVFALPMAGAALGGLVEEREGAGWVIAAPAARAAVDVTSLASLMTELESTYDDVGAIEKYAEDPTNQGWLMALTPDEYGTLVAAVAFVLDQPSSAETLAKVMGGKFSLHHIGAYLAKTEWGNPSRVEIIKKLAPEIANWEEQKAATLEVWHLSPFEKMLVGSNSTA